MLFFRVGKPSSLLVEEKLVRAVQSTGTYVFWPKTHSFLVELEGELVLSSRYSCISQLRLTTTGAYNLSFSFFCFSLFLYSLVPSTRLSWSSPVRFTRVIPKEIICRNCFIFVFFLPFPTVMLLYWFWPSFSQVRNFNLSHNNSCLY